ncbi:MAG: primosomal protein N' [Bacilli bacterium]|nr:primosomal protein N' [Bacilli bacterium]
MVAGVLVELSNKNIDKIFDYHVPESMVHDIKVGIRVEVPFGRQTLDGFVLELKDTSTMDLKDIIRVKDSDIVLDTELLELGKFLKKETLSTLISCYQVMLPKALKANVDGKSTIKMDTYYVLGDADFNDFKITDKQRQIIDAILEGGYIARKDALEISSSSIKTLLTKEIIREEKKEHYRLSYSDKVLPKKELTTDQKRVVEEVRNSSDSIYLLYGVTGSGKTEVYMELIEEQLSLGKTSIVLVPEISLTPQMVSRFQQRFGNQIAALHSALSDGEKYDEWRRIARGEASIVIGARSAIFAPLKNIGIIIVDEEHSESYKQADSNPRYHAIDIAKKRSEYHHCKVVLGSATPSLESFARAKRGVYHLLELPNRVNGKTLPKVTIVDLGEEMKRSVGHFSNILIDAMKKRIEKGEQIILLLNRRGYSSVLTCKNCGQSVKCPNCDITLTYHKTSNTLRCHYCGYGDKKIDICPKCGEHSMNDLGCGTERIEEELHRILDCRILRMDMDTTSRKGSHERMIESFKNHEYDILLGTQIVAKGLDFSNVTLVGVINADTGLNIPDFRSSENTFSLLSQVAGRSGRSEKSGEVIIQTFNPDHFAISFVKNHDYLSFYQKEMEVRRTSQYPPYYYLCYIRISGPDAEMVFTESHKIKRSLERNLKDVLLLGPTTCTIFK